MIASPNFAFFCSASCERKVILVDTVSLVLPQTTQGAFGLTRQASTIWSRRYSICECIEHLQERVLIHLLLIESLNRGLWDETIFNELRPYISFFVARITALSHLSQLKPDSRAYLNFMFGSSLIKSYVSFNLMLLKFEFDKKLFVFS